MTAAHYDVLVIGSGPGGYTGAIRAAQLGLKTACVEREPWLGGTCLRVGCIPSKALLESTARLSFMQHEAAGHGLTADKVGFDLDVMQRRKSEVVRSLVQGIDGLFKKNRVTRLTGHATLEATPEGSPQRVAIRSGNSDASETVTADRILIATGSKEMMLPGIEVDRERIGTSTEALAYDRVPEHLVVIGGGAIGLELGSVWRRLGAEVTVLEYAERILPSMDRELATGAQRILAKQGLTFRLGTKVRAATRSGQGCSVEVEGGDPIACDRVLMATGRVPNTDGLGLEAVGLAADGRGRIAVDAHFATKVPHIFAIGDVVAGPMLAHKAEEESVACVEGWVTGYGHVDYDAVPYVVYTHPEVAAVGATEESLKAAEVPYRKGSNPFVANSRARTAMDTLGFVKVLAHRDTDRILGVHILGSNAGEMIAEAATCMRFAASSEDVARTCHAHPTLAEAFREACLAVDGRAINL